MVFQNNVLMAAAGVDTGFSCDGVTFDGTNDYMRISELSGVSDGNELLLSIWIQRNQTTSEETIMGWVDGAANFGWDPDNWSLGMYTIGNALLYRIRSTTTYDTGSWFHVLFSCTAGTPYLYIDDTDVLNDVTSSDGSIGFTKDPITIAANSAGNTKLSADLAEFYYFPNEFLDISDAANRAKFSEDGKPIFLETDGSGPTGTAPAVYLHQDSGEAPANFKDNKGTGGDFTITGTLTASPDSPTD